MPCTRIRYVGWYAMPSSSTSITPLEALRREEGAAREALQELAQAGFD